MSEELQSSYDRVAENYAEQFRDEMDKKPFNRKMLDWLAEKVGGLGESSVTWAVVPDR